MKLERRTNRVTAPVLNCFPPRLFLRASFGNPPPGKADRRLSPATSESSNLLHPAVVDANDPQLQQNVHLCRSHTAAAIAAAKLAPSTFT
jgi:hypothetical protein